MSISFLVLTAVFMTGVGVERHLTAKNTNEEAKWVLQEAERMCEEKKRELEKAKENTDEALFNLFYTKQKVFNGTIKRFMTISERLKNIDLKENSDEILESADRQRETFHLQGISTIYSSVLSDGPKGVATIIQALVVSGLLTLVISGLLAVGTMLIRENTDDMAYLAGAASTTEFTLTAGAIAVIFVGIAVMSVWASGLRASLKADMNLEMAERIFAEAEKRVAETEISYTECEMIQMTAETFDDRITHLETSVLPRIEKLDDIIKERSHVFNKEKLDAGDLSQEELQFVMDTKTLISALKAHIDIPILKEGKLLDNALKTSDGLWKRMLPLVEQNKYMTC